MRHVLMAFLLAVALPARADEARIDYQKFELPNGLRVFVVEDHKAPTAYVVTWFMVGSKDELPKRTGFAHLFEHLMFKGSAHVPDGLMDRLLEEAGGWSNAFTSNDMTVYQNVAGSNFLEQMLWLDADRLAGLTETFDKPKLDNQRDVVQNERRQSVDNQPYGEADILIPEALWPKEHGYHWDTIGYHEDLVAATVEDVKAFFRTYYVPNNATMVIAGDVDLAKAKTLVEKYFGWIPKGPEPKRPVWKTPAPLTKEIRLTAKDQVQVPRVYVSWRGPGAYTADEAALDIAAAILSDGKSSRLYERLVYRERVAQDVNAYLDARAIGGVFQIVVTAKPGVPPEKLLLAVTEEVKRLSSAPPAAPELERAQNSHEASFLARLEPVMNRAIQLADYAVRARDPDFFPKDVARYRAVTAEQVKAATARYLKPNARVILTILPEGEKKGAAK
jgi:zinc protease